MNRALRLTLLLASLPLPFLIPGVPGLFGGQAAYRAAMLWGLPAAAALLASSVFSRWPGSSGPHGARIIRGAVPWGALRMAPWLLLAVLADFSFLGAGHLLGWVTFTFGDQGFSGHPGRTMAWSLPLCLVVATLGYEWTLRGTLLAAWAERIPRPLALFLSTASGVLLASPLIVPGLQVPDPHYVLAAFLTAAFREISFALIVLSGAGLVAAGLYHGLILCLDAFVINDWYSVHFPAANFTSSEPAFYLLRSMSAVLAAAMVAIGAHLVNRRRGRA